MRAHREKWGDFIINFCRFTSIPERMRVRSSCSINTSDLDLVIGNLICIVPMPFFAKGILPKMSVQNGSFVFVWVHNHTTAQEST